MRKQNAKLFHASLLATLLLLVLTSAARAQAGVICSPPSNCDPVYEFNPWDVTFSTGRQATFEEGERAESNEFYAIVLDTVAIGARCSDFKARRLATQRAFPKNKVFVSNYCDAGNVLTYDGFDDERKRNFIAVLVGEVLPEDVDKSPDYATEEDAKAFWQTARKKFPQAELVKMRAVLDFTDGQAQGITN